MAKENNNFIATVDSIYKGMDSFISTKTIVGEPITVNDITLIPLADVSFGMGAAAFASDKNNSGGGGLTGKISPTAILVVSNGSTRIVNVKNQDTTVKILDMLPDLIPEVVNKITEMIKGKSEEAKKQEEEVDKAVNDLMDDLKEENIE